MILLCLLPAGIRKALNAPQEFVGTSLRRWNCKNGPAPREKGTPRVGLVLCLWGRYNGGVPVCVRGLLCLWIRMAVRDGENGA
jgi:hypothetical protein